MSPVSVSYGVLARAGVAAGGVEVGELHASPYYWGYGMERLNVGWRGYRRRPISRKRPMVWVGYSHKSARAVRMPRYSAVRADTVAGPTPSVCPGSSAHGSETGRPTRMAGMSDVCGPAGRSTGAEGPRPAVSRSGHSGGEPPRPTGRRPLVHAGRSLSVADAGDQAAGRRPRRAGLRTSRRTGGKFVE